MASLAWWQQTLARRGPRVVALALILCLLFFVALVRLDFSLGLSAVWASDIEVEVVSSAPARTGGGWTSGVAGNVSLGGGGAAAATVPDAAPATQLPQPAGDGSPSTTLLNPSRVPFYSDASPSSDAAAAADEMHMFFIVVGEPALSNFQVALASMLLRRQCSLHLHLTTSARERAFLQSDFLPRLTPRFNSSLPLAVSWYDDVAVGGQCPYPYDSFRNGLPRAKMCLDVILPANVSWVVSADADMVFVLDVCRMRTEHANVRPELAACNCVRTPMAGDEALFDMLQREKPFGAVPQLTRWYRSHPTFLPCAIPEACVGVNTGLLIQDLEVLRRINWTQMWSSRMARDKVPLVLGDQVGPFTISTLPFPLDFFFRAQKLTIFCSHVNEIQDILNYVYKEFSLVYALGVEWNVQLIHMFSSTNSSHVPTGPEYAREHRIEHISVAHGNGRTFNQTIEEPWRRAFMSLGPQCMLEGYGTYLHKRLGLAVSAESITSVRECLIEQGSETQELLRKLDEASKK
jgi:hypothetical protein